MLAEARSQLFRVAHASRVFWWWLHKVSLIAKPNEACFGETPKPTRETRALPRLFRPQRFHWINQRRAVSREKTRDQRSQSKNR